MIHRRSSSILQSSSSSSGFTLIEILLVTVIILIATAVSVPLVTGTLQSTQMRDAMRTTVRMARYARSMAILKQTESTLTFKDREISISTSVTNRAEVLITRKFPNDIVIDEFENPTQKNSASEEDGYTVRYYPTGMNDGFTLTLSDGDTRRVEIACHPITGKVTVEE